MSCPACRFPVHEDQPQMRVHMGVMRDDEGFMVDLLPVFHKPCAAAYLIAKGRAKTEAQHGHNTSLEERREQREASTDAAVAA